MAPTKLLQLLGSRILPIIISVQVLTTGAAQPVIDFTPVITGLTQPIDFVNAGDGTNRIFVARQNGVIEVYNQSYSLIGNFLTVTELNAGGEEGLLSIVFHPNYETNGFFWVYYTNDSSNLQLDRYQVSMDPNVADVASRRTVLTIEHPGQSNHNGGKLNFGEDGMLYLSVGDGGGGGDVPNNAQTGTVLLGKVLRLDVNATDYVSPMYSSPAGNPGIGDPMMLDEIWALGLRNPFRWSFDPVDDMIWIGDVGQNAWEEINRVASATGGINYGWRCYEGNNPYNPMGCAMPPTPYTFPIYEYSNPGNAAVTGGIVYRGSGFPSMQGYYFAADVYLNTLYVINATSLATTTQAAPGAIVGFGQTEAGELFAVSLNGTIYQLAPQGALPVVLKNFTAMPGDRSVRLGWETLTEQDLRHFEIEFSPDGVRFEKAGSVQALNRSSGASYSFDHRILAASQLFYRLRMVDFDGSFSYSPVVQLRNVQLSNDLVRTNFIRNGMMEVLAHHEANELRLINMNGAMVRKMNIRGRRGVIEVPVSSLPAGAYVVQVVFEHKLVSQKVVVGRD